MPDVTSVFFAQAPSNIALIKYMGKKDAVRNLPENPSLSMTLKNLCTYARVERRLTENGARPEMKWNPGFPVDSIKSVYPLREPKLSEKGVSRMEHHMQRVAHAARELLPQWRLKTVDINRLGLSCQSANTFPEGAGIASSASSFAAVTLAVMQACAEDPETFKSKFKQDMELKRALAHLSQQGSGSSCRSFEGPWVLWNEDRAVALEAQISPLVDLVIVVSETPKQVSSSEAHQRVKSSPLWNGRFDRVHRRIADVQQFLLKNDLKALARVSWQEAWEMHSLFHTSDQPFSYWEPGTLKILKFLEPWVWSSAGGEEAPPIVTLDAGANVHVLVKAADKEKWRARFQELWSSGPETTPDCRPYILEDEQGQGAGFC